MREPAVRHDNGEIACNAAGTRDPLETSILTDIHTLSPNPIDLDRVADLIRASERLVVFTGAGISTESGIPDYRGPNGVWARQAIPHIDTIPTDRESRLGFWQERKRRYPEMVAREPNAGHLAIAEFEQSGHLLAIVTQNIDGLHQKAGNSPERVIELHGSTHVIRCTNCGRTYTGTEIQARLEAGEDDPRCPVCGGILRTGTILFGEALPEQALRVAYSASKLADVMLVVGSSLVVNPAARLPVVAKENGARLVIINQSPTPLDHLADIRIEAGAGETLSGIAERVFAED
jgi:NAD-dependent deacetylase